MWVVVKTQLFASLPQKSIYIICISLIFLKKEMLLQINEEAIPVINMKTARRH